MCVLLGLVVALSMCAGVLGWDVTLAALVVRWWSEVVDRAYNDWMWACLLGGVRVRKLGRSEQRSKASKEAAWVGWSSEGRGWLTNRGGSLLTLRCDMRGSMVSGVHWRRSKRWEAMSSMVEGGLGELRVAVVN